MYEYPQYKAFVRKDRRNWSFTEFYLVGLLILPFRVLFLLTELSILWLLIKPYSLCFLRGPNIPMNKYYRLYVNFLIQIFSRLFLFTMGFIWISRKKARFDTQKYPNLSCTGKLEDALMIISNHVSDFDSLVHSASGDRGYVSKMAFKYYPFFGFFAENL